MGKKKIIFAAASTISLAIAATLFYMPFLAPSAGTEGLGKISICGWCGATGAYKAFATAMPAALAMAQIFLGFAILANTVTAKQLAGIVNIVGNAAAACMGAALCNAVEGQYGNMPCVLYTAHVTCVLVFNVAYVQSMVKQRLAEQDTPGTKR